MALTRVAAIQMLVLSPEVVGLSKQDCDKSLEGYIHVWAAVGKMLGMEDGFNSCLYNRPSIIQHHVKEWFIPLLQEVDEYSVLLQKATIEASGMVLDLPLIVILPIRMLASQLQLVPQHIAIVPDGQDIY